jgi:hypothetical protein
MTYNNTRSQIESRLATEFAKSPPYPIGFQNIDFDPPNDTPFLKSTIIFGDRGYLTLMSPTDGFDRINGTLTIDIYTPQGLGQGANLTICQRVIDLFNRVKLTGLQFDSANGPNYIESAQPQGHYQTQISITFTAYK